MDEAMAVFEEVRLWDPMRKPVDEETILEKVRLEDRPFVSEVYRFTRDFYEKLPPRRDGTPAFTHPTNVAMFLGKAQCQPHVVAAGLLHDLIEDQLESQGDGGISSVKKLEEFETTLRGRFGDSLKTIAAKTGFPRDIAERIVEIVWTLTRHKSHLYYKSISQIFTHTDHSVRLRAALVKLADRMHNVLTIDNYTQDKQIYQCFKNIFILNNVKQLRSEIRNGRTDKRMVQSLEKLFKKCGKATFLGLTEIECQYYAQRGRMFSALIILSLSLRKFMHEIKGLWSVTDAPLQPGEPVYYLYHGIVKKYDHLLHHEENEYNQRVAAETEYIAETFTALELDARQIAQAISYKDAIALKEVVASLLYLDRYIIRGFQCSELCRRNQKCLTEKVSEVSSQGFVTT